MAHCSPAAGRAAVVFRAFGDAGAGQEAQRLREVTARRGVRLLIGLDEALAETVAADGVHLPERAIDQAAGLRRRHPDWLITIALHRGPEDSLRGADAVVLSPVFQAGGSSAGRAALGVDGFRRMSSEIALPAYALGGVAAQTVDGLTGSGACGIAAVDAVRTAWG